MIFVISSFFRRYLAVLLTLALGLNCQLLLLGCQPANLKTHAVQVSQLVLSTLNDPKTFNPALNQEFPNIFLFTFEGLTRENGVTGAIEPALAESWQISEDKKRVIFTLRENLKWSDGQPLTADDVLFTFEDVSLNKRIPTDLKDGLKIGVNKAFPHVNKLDERRVEFILPEPFAPLLRAIAQPDGVAILPKHILAESIKSLDSQGNPRFVSTWATDTNPSKISEF